MTVNLRDEKEDLKPNNDSYNPLLQHK